MPTTVEPSSSISDASAPLPSGDLNAPAPQAPLLPTNSPILADPGSSQSMPGNASSSHSIRPNPRSCITCRRRKVRCNKMHPCSNCNKANIECVFPGPGRAPRKPKNRPDSELLVRLRRLEGIVKSLGGEVNNDGQLDETNDLKNRFSHQVDADLLKHPNPRNLVQREVEQEFGRLVIGDGKSRYVSNRLWAKLGDEVEEMRDILGASSDEEEDYSSPENRGLRSTHPQSHDGFIFGFASLAQSLREIHPSPEQILVLLNVYLENVAPLLPIFHKPTLRKYFFRAAHSLDSLTKNTEAAMFSVYYAAITSMDSSQCLSLLGEDRHIMLSRSRAAMEQAMARANLLGSQSVILLQAVVLFLLCVRRQDDSRYVWSMVAIVVRLAQGLGIHRDGLTFALQPFETEMRRRLWWHICFLDFQAAEDHGCDPFIHESFSDTRIPLNVNDDDFCQESTEAPKERVECTDLTFSLIRCEIVAAARRLSHIAPSSACSKTSTDISLEQREEQILELSKRIEERYVQYCNMTTPILWACATISRLAVSRLWISIHQPMSGLGQKGLGFADDKHNRLFLTSVEVLEFSCLLQTNENTKKWSWLFRTHMQWNSIAFLLSELCVRPHCPAVDRAWHAVNSVYKIWNLHERKGTVWRAINKLMARAVQFREIGPQKFGTQFGDTGGETNDKTIESTDDPSHTRTEGRSKYISPVLQSQGETNKTSGIPPGINMEPNEMFYSSPDIQSTLNPVPFSDGGDVVSHSSAIGIYPWLQQLPQGNRAMDPILTSSGPPSVHEPSWDDWDQVVREFQMDIAEGVQSDNTNARDWYE